MSLRLLKIAGNTIIVVEHDEDTIRHADHIIDLGPGAGALGGYVTGEGSLKDIEGNSKSLTGLYLSRRKEIPVFKSRYRSELDHLEIKGVKEHNLKNLHVKVPLACLVGVSGVSGSGKSTLVNETIYPIVSNHLNGFARPAGKYKTSKGLKFLDRIIQINQKPIGRTPRSIPATYVGLFQMVRQLFSSLPESQLRGYSPGHFSFNVAGGRCENCKGAGFIKLEMRFLPKTFTRCDVCEGKRYNSEVLNIKYRNKNISDVLNFSVAEALDFFQNHKLISHRLKCLDQVGLGYIRLGQSSTTLSGGEAQRVKLSKELSKTSIGKTLYILDEPTTGLHFEDIKKLIELLRSLVDKGHTVLVIEHNLDVLKCCDYLIDLGPEGGEAGGFVVAEGPPQDVAKNESSHTGRYLKKVLNSKKRKPSHTEEVYV